MSKPPLTGDVVVDFSSGIAGAYVTKILADAGATVVKVEDRGGDPLRKWTACGVDVPEGDDGALFQFLACSKQSVVVDPNSSADVAMLHSLIDSANGVVWSPGSEIAALPEFEPRAISKRAPHATVMSITNFGLDGPWKNRVATEATIQTWSGSPGQRGTLERSPLLAGGGAGEWETGLCAAVSYLASRYRTFAEGKNVGELVDVSALESNCLTMVMYPVTYPTIAGAPRTDVRAVMLPGIYEAKDGYVGFMVVTGQQWLDFCAMIEHPEWAEDETLGRIANRMARRNELLPHIQAWIGERTCDEIAELATLLRIPVAVLGNGETLPKADHLIEREMYRPNPRSGFAQPGNFYRFGGSATTHTPEAPPHLGEHTEQIRTSPRTKIVAGSLPTNRPRPFEGLRVADFTANWAGPIIAHVLGMLGADVIKIESAQRPDPLRFNSVKPFSEDRFWEWSPLQHGPNTSKRGITLDMQSKRGQEIAMELLKISDITMENFSPRVVEQWGLTWDRLKEINPRLIFVRAPAYGIDGPWRERTGYAQTIEMTSGLAWVTGHPDEAPDIPNGMCDPNAGLHALVALLLALEHRRKTGEGMLLETPMVGGALNVGSVQVIEFSAYGHLLGREGNRSPSAAPQNIYRTATSDLPHNQGRWVTISVATDSQWAALKNALGNPAWASAAAYDTFKGRRANHDAIDAELSSWCAAQEADAIVELLDSAGVPSAKVIMPHEQINNPQLQSRGFFTDLVHPVTGKNTHGGFPAIFSTGPDPAHLHTSPPPCLGQHNKEVLGGLLGMSDAELAQLEADGVIGTKVGGGSAW